ncbi:endo-1,4-beta-xylanase xylA, putative, partial (macronuclear) [Tetrahymena thermophila SB210]
QLKVSQLASKSMNNMSLQGIYSAYCSNVMQGVQTILPQQNNIQNSLNTIQGPLCQYYNSSLKKYRNNSHIIQQTQGLISEQKKNFREAQNVKLQKYLNQQIQGQQYPYLQQQTNNLQMLILKDLYSNFFQDIMREYKFYQQVMTDIDLQYPIQNKIKKSSNNNKEWFEQNYINILKSQITKNSQIKQTIMQFRNTNIPKKVQKIISKQQSFHKNRILIEIDQEEVNDVSGIKKQFQIQQQGLFQSVSPLNKIGKNEVKFKITSRNQIINSSNSVTRTENNWRVQKKEESNSKNSQIFQKRVPLKDKKENQYLAEGEAKRYNSVTKRYINYDSNTTNTSYNAFNKVQNQNFKKYDSKTENDQQLSDEEEFTYMAGGVKIRVNTLSGNTRCERSQSLIKELPNKLSDINLNKVNFSGQKNNNHQIINQRKILTDQLISISPKHNYQVYMDSKYFGNNDGNQQQPKYKTEQNIIDHYSLNWEKNQNIEEKSQILNFLKNQKQNSKQNLNIQQVSSVLIVNQNQPQINSSVLKQQNMQLLKIENLHTSPTSRSKQNSFSNSTNSNSYLDQSQARYRLQINPNCTQLPNMRIPSSNRVQGSSQTRGTEQSSLGVMPQQQSNQLSFQNQPLNPQIYTNLNEYFCQTPSQKQREINNQTSRQNKHEVKGSNIVQLTPLQSKSNSNLENKEEISKSKNQKRDKNTLKDLICSYYETPKNITGNAQSVLSQYSPINNRQDALKKQINLEIEQKNSINQQAQCQNNLPLNELELKQLDQNFLKEGNQAKSPYKNGFMREFKDINKQQQEIKELDSNIQLNIPNLLAKKESHLLNNTFNLQIANQDEEKQSQLQQIQNTIWFSNNQIFGLIQDNQNNTINDYKQDEQNINTIQAKLDEQQKYANYSQINIQNTYDDKYKIDINRSFQRRENSIEKDKKNDYKKNQILSSEFLNKAVNNQDEYIKQNQEKSYLLTDNSAIFQKLQNNIRSSPSTPFRKVNNSRQRIYQNQRQILTEIQKGNPVLSYIQTQYNQTLLKDNKMPQGVSNDKVSQLRKISLLPKEKIERQIDSLNNLKASSSERSQERQQYKNNNNNPYLQKSDFLKQVKKKQDKNKIIGQLLNLSEYSNLEGYSQLNTFKENSCQQNSIESTKRKNKNQCENDQKEGISELQYKTNKQNCAQQEITKPNINCNLNKYEIQQKFQLEAIMNNQPNVVRI